MNERVSAMRDQLRSRAYREHARDVDIGGAFRDPGLSGARRSALRLRAMLAAERPVVFLGERISLLRTVRSVPELYSPEEKAAIRREHFTFSTGCVNNICSDYGRVIAEGFDALRQEALDSLRAHAGDPVAVDFLESVLITLDAAADLAARYGEEARRVGNRAVSALFARIPKRGAQSFHEALQCFRLLNFVLWANKNHHVTMGRFDQYMYPYYQKDLASGALTRDEALELIEELFLSLNRDTWLYHGIQQGDNGQTIVLGGCNRRGEPAFNELSELCLRASLDLGLIDPKVNLRVGKDTPEEIFRLGTELTKRGLGFPQYSNDDVVIPALLAKGYALEDARNYAVAACWEFIIPGKGMEVPNIGAFSFPRAVSEALNDSLAESPTFEAFQQKLADHIQRTIDGLLPGFQNLHLEPSPFQSALMDGCVQRARDISLGAQYNNYGIHGVGIASAADALAAVKRLVYDEGAVSKTELLDALEHNFRGREALRARLRNEAPKMGNADPYVDALGYWLMERFADALDGKRNDRGGLYRPGSGTAMFYLWSANELGATADGRAQGEPFGANFSPSLQAGLDGPLSVIKSFAGAPFQRVMNGGPLTMELHDTVFKGEEGCRKVAQLVQSFIRMGGHQMQLNAINREQLLDAQRHPENHQGLIVRVWGWSGFFVELDREYQDHILRRAYF